MRGAERAYGGTERAYGAIWNTRCAVLSARMGEQPAAAAEPEAHVQPYCQAYGLQMRRTAIAYGLKMRRTAIAYGAGFAMLVRYCHSVWSDAPTNVLYCYEPADEWSAKRDAKTETALRSLEAVLSLRQLLRIPGTELLNGATTSCLKDGTALPAWAVDRAKVQV
eukprot:3940717-Rhodomonas_salina.1